MFWIILYLLGSLIGWIIVTYFIADEFINNPFEKRNTIFTVALHIVLMQLCVIVLSWILTLPILWVLTWDYRDRIASFLKKSYINIKLTIKYWWFLIVDIPL